MRILAIVLSIAFLPFTPTVWSQSPQEPRVNYLFRDTFYASPDLKLKYDIYETADFLLVRGQERGPTGEFAVMTGFEGPVIESRVLKNVRTIEAANAFLEKNTRKIFFERVPIKELPLARTDGSVVPMFWVGQKAFSSLEQAQSSVAEVRAIVEAGGGNFDRALTLIGEFFPEAPAPTEEEAMARYLREEELALKVLDWLDIGEEPFGIFQGVPPGEKILWQSFGETSYRFTNLDSPNYDSQVGYWTNRIVFRGIRFIGEPTVDPFVEVTAALESNGKNFPSHLDLIAGLEYRPFQRIAYFENFNVDGLQLLKFMRGYRLFIQYMERRNLTDEITGSRDIDLWFGAGIFYEWGLDLKEPWAKKHRERVSDWIREFVWGEYYGSYRYERSDFAAIDEFNSWVWNSSLILGLKWPSIQLPKNPVNDELLLMPYLRFEHVTNPRRTSLGYQNRLFVVGGIRWMPFRSYQFQNNEWLFLTKIFAEYVGIGAVQHPGSVSGNVPQRDWFIGAKASFKRF